MGILKLFAGNIFCTIIPVLLMTAACYAVKNDKGMSQNISKENEMVRPNVSTRYCKEKFSCESNYSSSCYCDRVCELVGDCCGGLKTNNTLDIILEKSQFSCYKMPRVSVGNLYGALVVAKCPTNWTDDGSRSLCEDGRRKVVISETYINSDRIVFKNIFCAYCSNALPNMYSFETLKACTTGNVGDHETNFKCINLYNKNVDIESIRTCHLQVIDKCSIETSIDMQNACSTGEYAPVYDTFGNMYRNIECGLCNDILKEDFSCERDKVYVGDPYALSIIIANRPIYTSQIKHYSSGKASKTTYSHDNTEKYLTIISLVISILSLLTTLTVYKCFPVLLNTPGKITFCLALSLLFAQFLFLISSETEPIPELCITMAILGHYFFLAAFCWMNVIAFDLWMTFANHVFDCEEDEKFVYYNLYAWIVPAIVVTLSAIFNFTDVVGSFNPQYGKDNCWISSENAKMLFFLGPLAFFTLFDIVAFSCTVYFIVKTRRETTLARGEGKRNTCMFLIYLKLWIIMGLTWIFAFMAKYSDNMALWYMFIVFNSLQGFFIFVCFICTKKVYHLVRGSSFRRFHNTSSNTSKARSSKETKSTSV